MSSSVNLFGIICVFLTVSCNFSSTSAGETQAEILRGVTIKHWPYADRDSGKFRGYAVDIMNEISDIVGFEYRLYFSPDGKYGAVVDNKLNGMIGEVYNNRADFAIADLSATDIRKKYVDFTEPLINTSIGILIHKRNARNIGSFRDLADQTDIKYGTFRNSYIANQFAQSSDPVIRKMNDAMTRNPEVFVSNAREGVEKVNTTQERYAFLVESTFAEFLSGLYCELTHVEDKNHYFPRQYAIAMTKDSAYIPKFNSAINKLKSNGQLDRIKARYWRDRCEENTIDNRTPSDKRDNKPIIKWADKGYDLSKGVKVSNYSSILLLILSFYSIVLK